MLPGSPRRLARKLPDSCGGRGAREVDTRFGEPGDYPPDRLSLNKGGISWLCRNLEAKQKSVVEDVGDPLKLQRLDDELSHFRIVHHLKADRFGYFSHSFEINIACDTQVELQRDPISAEIGDAAELSERNDVDLSVLVTKLDGA